jgi:hypothetical protein
MTQRWERRHRKREAARQRMQKHGRSLFQVLSAIEERASKPARRRKARQK